MAWEVADREQRRHENRTEDQRHEFERDRDRVLYSSAFHRLAGITQIVRAGEADVFHTRQQHSFKVAQVGRRLGQKLLREQEAAASFRGLDPEVVEAACMAHDLGHPPFGHVGEHTLNDLLKNHEDEGFEGNAQSFRILTKLAVRFPKAPGINLTRATLAACLKYPWHPGEGKKSVKWSAYISEADDFNFARAHHQHEQKTLEAELMDWADDVAYSVHDLEDFHRCNALPWQRVFDDQEAIIRHAMGSSTDESKEAALRAAYDRLLEFFDGFYSGLLSDPYDGSREQREQLRRMTSQLIGTYIDAIKINEDHNAEVAVTFNEDLRHEVLILKQITRDYIIASPTLAAQQHGQKRIIKELFEALWDGCGANKAVPDFLPIRLRYLRDVENTSRGRFVTDCIASLSESEAVALHGRLTGSATGSVLDPIVR